MDVTQPFQLVCVLMELDSVNASQNTQAESVINVTKDITTFQNVKVSKDNLYNFFFYKNYNVQCSNIKNKIISDQTSTGKP